MLNCFPQTYKQMSNKPNFLLSVSLLSVSKEFGFKVRAVTSKFQAITELPFTIIKKGILPEDKTLRGSAVVFIVNMAALCCVITKL